MGLNQELFLNLDFAMKLHISEARVERRTPPLRAGDAESHINACRLWRSDNPDLKTSIGNLGL